MIGHLLYKHCESETIDGRASRDAPGRRRSLRTRVVRQQVTKRPFRAILLAAVLSMAGFQAGAEDDQRTAVTLPGDVAADFLAEMRTHLANLDDMVAALAADDFKAAARVAEMHMTFGHRRWKRMAESGASDQEIAAAKQRFKQMRESGSARPGRGMGMGMGRGFGRFMPDDFRAMGAAFHEAAESFATAAKAASSPPSPKDYKAVLDALGTVTAACRGCHDAFRIEVAK